MQVKKKSLAQSNMLIVGYIDTVIAKPFILLIFLMQIKIYRADAHTKLYLIQKYAWYLLSA